MANALWCDDYEARREGYDTRKWGQMEYWLPGGSFRNSPPSNVSPEKAQELIKSLDEVIKETGFDMAEFQRLEQRRHEEDIRWLTTGYGTRSVLEDRKQGMLSPVGMAMLARGYKLKELTINWAGIVGVGMDKGVF